MRRNGILAGFLESPEEEGVDFDGDVMGIDYLVI